MHTGTTATTHWNHYYDTLVPLLHHGGTTVTSRWYHCYGKSVPPLRHTGTTATTCWNHYYDTLAPQLRQTIRSFEMAVAIRQSTRRNIPEEFNVQYFCLNATARTHTHARTHMHTSASSRSILKRSTRYRMLQGTVTDRTLGGYTNAAHVTGCYKALLPTEHWLVTQTCLYVWHHNGAVSNPQHADALLSVTKYCVWTAALSGLCRQ